MNFRKKNYLRNVRSLPSEANTDSRVSKVALIGVHPAVAHHLEYPASAHILAILIKIDTCQGQL